MPRDGRTARRAWPGRSSRWAPSGCRASSRPRWPNTGAGWLRTPGARVRTCLHADGSSPPWPPPRAGHLAAPGDAGWRAGCGRRLRASRAGRQLACRRRIVRRDAGGRGFRVGPGDRGLVVEAEIPAGYNKLGTLLAATTGYDGAAGGGGALVEGLRRHAAWRGDPAAQMDLANLLENAGDDANAARLRECAIAQNPALAR